MTTQGRIAQASSVLIRTLSYFFLRWALLPVAAPVIFALFAVNVPAQVLGYLSEPKYDVIGEDINVVVTDTVKTNEDGEPTEAEEVDVEDTLLLQEKNPRFWHSLLLGAPGPSKALTVVTVLINAALVAMVADRLYTEHSITAADLSFVRLGYVSDTEAKFVIREPNPAQMPVTIQMRLQDAEAPFESSQWQVVGGMQWADNSTDFTGVLTVPLPHREQRAYEWVSSNNHSGHFTAAPKAGSVPALFNGSFTFLATSCIVSRIPYSPLDHALAIPGMRHLARVLPSLGAQFMLFLGDFIYIDVPRRWGASVEDYRQKYRQVYASPDWPAVGQNLSWIHVLDDHEIANDWSANTTGVYNASVDPWRLYQAAANPPVARQAGTRGYRRSAATYFEFAQGPASFFLLDTRSYRSSNSLPANSTAKTMLGAEQLADLLDYLRRPEPKGVRWKIVASSVPFTKNWRVNTRDTWGGFLAERRIVLEAMWDAGLRGTGVIILSGDRHEFAATRFPPPPDASSRWPASVAVHEFSASPLNQFFSPIPTYLQRDDEDVKIRYINWGHSKFGAITIRPPAEAGSSSSSSSSLEYRLFVDGVQAWNTTLEAPEAAEEFKEKSLWSKLLGN